MFPNSTNWLHGPLLVKKSLNRGLAQTSTLLAPNASRPKNINPL